MLGRIVSRLGRVLGRREAQLPDPTTMTGEDAGRRRTSTCGKSSGSSAWTTRRGRCASTRLMDDRSPNRLPPSRARTAPAVASLVAEVRSCTLCAQHLPLGPRPVLQLHPAARILIAAQAPGRKVHETGVPFDDASGDRLRGWLGLTRDVFYNPELVAIVPMAFCYPGKGPSGDLPPRPECAPRWRAPLLGTLKQLRLTLLIGRYALAYHLPEERAGLTAAVQDWRRHGPALIPLPHPSPTNNRWLARNRWFERELIPALRARVAEALAGAANEA